MWLNFLIRRWQSSGTHCLNQTNKLFSMGLWGYSTRFSENESIESDWEHPRRIILHRYDIVVEFRMYTNDHQDPNGGIMHIWTFDREWIWTNILNSLCVSGRGASVELLHTIMFDTCCALESKATTTWLFWEWDIHRSVQTYVCKELW